MPLPSQEGFPLDVDAVARGLAELEFDARVALPEAQERFQRVEAENRRLRERERGLIAEMKVLRERLREHGDHA